METYLTIEELGEYLKIAEKTIRSWVLHRIIPFHKILKSIRFWVSEIEKWINDGCYSVLSEEPEDRERDLLDEAISFDELAEEEAANQDDEGGGRRMTDFDCTRGYEVPEANTLPKQKPARMGEVFDKAIEEAKVVMLPYESWERFTGESSSAFATFCAYRDFGLERNIRKAVDSYEKDEKARAKRYRVWRNWSTQFHWKERAADYDRYTERLKQSELRKTIEAQGERHRGRVNQRFDVEGLPRCGLYG